MSVDVNPVVPQKECLLVVAGQMIQKDLLTSDVDLDLAFVKRGGDK